MMRFDCHKINELACVKIPLQGENNQKILFLVAAGNDNYLRFFNELG